MVTTKCLIAWLLMIIVVSLAHAHNTTTSKIKQTDSNDAPAEVGGSDSSNRTGRIMKILRDPQSTVAPLDSKRMRSSQKAQSRREHFPPPALPPALPVPYRSFSPTMLGTRHESFRRIHHNGPPPNVLMPYPQPPASSARPQQLLAYGKGTITLGKGSVYRQQHFTPGGHPNSLPPPRIQQGFYHQQSPPHPPNSFINFKPSAQYSGIPILRPAKAYPQYTKLLKQYLHNPDVRQHPLPQQHPQLLQEQHQQQQQKKHQQYFSQRPTEQSSSLSSSSSASSSSSSSVDQQTYSVYEEPEFNDRPPTTAAPVSAMATKEAEEYIKFMSTNEYFLPKINPNYKEIDETGSIRHYRQPQPQPSIHYSKSVPANSVSASGAGNFKQPSEVTQLFYQPASSSSIDSSAVVRGSYQAGKNAFVVRSDGNKGVKHVISNSLGTTQATTATSHKYSTYQEQFNLRPQKPKTQNGPVHFEFTENDAIREFHGQTKLPAPTLRYKGHIIQHAPTGVYIQHSAGNNPSATSFVYQKHPNSVNDVDSDPEDGDDMHDTATGTFGRVAIRNPLQKMSVDEVNESSSIAPATEQKDTEEFCERMCSNVQDDEEVVCGSDGYMYTSEAQMECYASCLHIEVTIQGKGTCSAR